MSHVNCEFKAKVSNIDFIRSYLKSNGDFKGTDYQKDTYFNTNVGRLKLRQGNIENTLIQYNRENLSGAKQSLINLEHLPKGTNVLNVLKESLGIKVVVNKAREIYFINNVKFHIDKVDGLGNFFEVEAISSNNEFCFEELTEQCNFYKDKFNIKDSDTLSVSYSDMIIEKADSFKNTFYKKGEAFLSNLSEEFPIHEFLLDHLCYRVESDDDYSNFKDKLSFIGDLLVESEIGGRLISTFRLNAPILLNNLSIHYIELPQAKKSSFYQEGFEHLEVVTKDDLHTFSAKYPDLIFCAKGLNKSHNPELKLKLKAGNIKFHNKLLAEMIQDEIR